MFKFEKEGRKKEKEKITELMVQLLNELKKRDLIDIDPLLDCLGDRTIVKLRFSRKFNYETVAEMLRQHGLVFIPVSRSGSCYALERLRGILGGGVYKERARWGDEWGYIMSYEEEG